MATYELKEGRGWLEGATGDIAVLPGSVIVVPDDEDASKKMANAVGVWRKREIPQRPQTGKERPE